MSYDRQAASRILAELAAAGLFTSPSPPRQTRIDYAVAPVEPEPGSHLTPAQIAYLRSYMQPCTSDQVTSATHRIRWDDSDGIPNAGYFGPSSLGPVVPIAVRETTLALWRDLAVSPARGAAERAVLAATTTDQEPLEIFRVGIEATGRALAQHALIADQTPYTTPAKFARGLRESGIFVAVASRWFWELQASTYRRGMIPVRFGAMPGGGVRYTAETLAVLRDMKQRTIATAHDVIRRATGEDGLTVAAAVEKYHDEQDLISRQYALLDESEQPRCLAATTHVIDGDRFSVLSIVVDRFIDAFARTLESLEITALPTGSVTGSITDPRDRVFDVPDMTCKHCVATISGVLASMDVEVLDASLVTKRFVANFATLDVRERAFEAIRSSGYTVVPSRLN
jgi:copper chaperone CopZ